MLPVKTIEVSKMKTILLRWAGWLVTVLLLSGAANAQQVEPVDYVRICDAFGTGFFYAPGTDTCISSFEIIRNTSRIGDIEELLDGPNGVFERLRVLEDSIAETQEGVAIGISMSPPALPDGKSTAVGMNWGTFNGENAMGLSGITEIDDTFAVSGAVGVGVSEGAVGGRIGFQASW